MRSLGSRRNTAWALAALAVPILAAVALRSMEARDPAFVGLIDDDFWYARGTGVEAEDLAPGARRPTLILRIVHRQDRRPAAGARVRWLDAADLDPKQLGTLRSDAADPERWLRELGQELVADEAGVCKLPWSGGRAEVSAQHLDGWCMRRLQPGGPNELLLELHPTPQTSVRVSDTRGLPQARVPVTLSRRGSDGWQHLWNGTTDAAGLATISGLDRLLLTPGAGDFGLSFRFPLAEPPLHPLELGRRGKLPIELKLPATGSLTVLFEDEIGRPLAERYAVAVERAGRAGADESMIAVRSEAGRASFPLVGLGLKLRLTIDPIEGGARTEREIHGPSRAGEEKTVVVTLTESDLELTVTSSDPRQGGGAAAEPRRRERKEPGSSLAEADPEWLRPGPRALPPTALEGRLGGSLGQAASRSAARLRAISLRVGAPEGVEPAVQVFQDERFTLGSLVDPIGPGVWRILTHEQRTARILVSAPGFRTVYLDEVVEDLALELQPGLPARLRTVGPERLQEADYRVTLRFESPAIPPGRSAPPRPALRCYPDAPFGRSGDATIAFPGPGVYHGEWMIWRRRGSETLVRAIPGVPTERLEVLDTDSEQHFDLRPPYDVLRKGIEAAERRGR